MKVSEMGSDPRLGIDSKKKKQRKMLEKARKKEHEKLDRFVSELTELSRRHGIVIDCCESPEIILSREPLEGHYSWDYSFDDYELDWEWKTTGENNKTTNTVELSGGTTDNPLTFDDMRKALRKAGEKPCPVCGSGSWNCGH